MDNFDNYHIISLFYFNKKETFYNILPYSYDWNIYKCLDMDCVKQKSLKCFEACDSVHKSDKIDRPEFYKIWKNKKNLHISDVEQCKMACMNEGDHQSDVLKWNNYTWNSLLPKFSKVSLLNKNADWSD